MGLKWKRGSFSRATTLPGGPGSNPEPLTKLQSPACLSSISDSSSISSKTRGGHCALSLVFFIWKLSCLPQGVLGVMSLKTSRSSNA